MVDEQVRICVLTERYPPQDGGVAVAAARLVALLVEEGHDVHVVHPFAREDAPLQVDVAVEDGVTLHRIHYPEWDREAVETCYRHVVRLHEEHRFHVLHAFFLTMAHLAHFANHHPRLAHPPRWVIASARGDDALNRIFFPWWRDIIHEALAAPTTWLTSVNRFYVRSLQEQLELDLSERSTTIHNGVSAVPEGRRWQLGPHNRGVVGTVGVFRPVKDLPLLIRAYAGLSADVRRELLLAGFFDPQHPEEEDWSRCLIDELGIAFEIDETGRFQQPEVGDHLRRMRVYVQPSAYEGMPNALLEAASHGVPLVATAVGGMAEIIDDGETGLLVPHGEPGRLSAAIGQVLSDDRLAQRLGQGALRLAARHSRVNEAEDWRHLYARLLRRPPPRDRLPLAWLTVES